MGPSTRDVEVVKGLLRSGMNVARFNFSHGDHEYHAGMIDIVRRASAESGIPVALMLDTKGPEIRTGEVPDGGKILLSAGDEVTVTTEPLPCDSGLISISYAGLPDEIGPENHIFIADGLVDLAVLSVEGRRIRCRVVNGGEFGSRKNVNVPKVRTNLPAVTERDVADIRFGVEKGVDFIAASFIRKPQDVLTILRLLGDKHTAIRVIAKIEDEEGLENIEEIIRVSGGVMVARGDLGVQLEPQEIPLVQKRIINRCHALGKPVITATQMLESMVKNPRPTRAETSDVANAIFDGTDAVMLSGETAAGAYPVLAVEVMHKIAMAVECSDEYKVKMRDRYLESSGRQDLAQATCRAAYAMAEAIGAAAIVTPTVTGMTPRILSQYRPDRLLVAVTPYEAVQRQLLLNWGVCPIVAPFVRDSEEMIQNAIKAAIDAGFAQRSDKVVVAAGLPVSTAMMTNTVRAYYIGNVIGRGEKGFGGRCTGRIVRADNLEEAVIAIKKDGGADILLTHSLPPEFIPLVRMAAGVIVESVTEMPWDMIRMTNPDLVCIAEVPDAMEKFENGLTVTLDGEEKVIYEGVL
jgi:pyruvate kinase